MSIYSRIRFAPDKELAALRANPPSAYCVRVDQGDLEKLGYRYSQERTRQFWWKPDSRGNFSTAPMYFFDRGDATWNDDYITLYLLPNKCLQVLRLTRTYWVDQE